MNPYIYILGTVQDGGFPHAGCKKNCCKDAFTNPSLSKKVSSIAIVDPSSKQQWIIDASPDFKDQYHTLQKQTKSEIISGILLTHAHIGHYLGLAQLGKEVIDCNNINVFAMEKMSSFLKKNGPWNQLITNNNISLTKIESDLEFELNNKIHVTPILVPHREDYSETVCFFIASKQKKLLYVPDIDKWKLWDKDILQIIKSVDYALIDGTFYDENELERDMSKIPHPFVEESMNLFIDLPANEKSKIYFTHLNHTNPLLIENSFEQKKVRKKGFNIAKEGLILEL